MKNNINGCTKSFAVIGDPIEHSLSPQIHNTIYNELNLNYAYLPFKIKPNDLREAVQGFKAIGLQGFNVTIPHKNDILQYLDQVSQDALLMGAVNTVKNVEGKLYGYNTDGEGFIRSLKKENVTVKNKNIIILGAGGSARGISVKIALEGAASITILNRTLEKAEKISRLINNNIEKICTSDILNKDTLDLYKNKYDILINTTSVGMHPNIDSTPIDFKDFLNPNAAVCDLIYNPEKTRLLQESQRKGCKIINGFGMLIYQAVAAFEIWTGVEVDENLIKILSKIS